ncbi:CHAT domain-containing protein [Streptomyces sp. SPB162]|uniref:CHAT domain-containing protein n=1 Tax=Streptomyces sp. SPB162 TaxID=2940560 RepID=UPI00240678CC|nr:CHAT domain-containing protein [Streptomyces sp. SPB162]MDF9811474.1 hypothetical protein [Streptomyces sp. SPB162]
MPSDTTPPPPRSATEGLLRLLLASEEVPDSLPMEAEARAALLLLLADDELDAAAFDEEFTAVFVDYEAFALLWDHWMKTRQDGLRGSARTDGADLREQAPTEPEADADADAERPADRFLNLCLTWPLSRRVVPRDRRLGVGVTYELRVDIGDLSAESLLAAASQPFPEHPLDHNGDWLDVLVMSADFTVYGERHPYFLPRVGPGWVCPCQPGGHHTCAPEHQDRYLRVRVSAPPETGPASLRLIVTNRGNQLQSVSLTAQVALREEPGAESLTAHIDHTLVDGFTGIADLPERTAGIRVARRRDGGVTVDVLGAGTAVSTFWLNELLLRGTLDRARRVLGRVHAERADGAFRNRLRAGNRKPDDELFADLSALAQLGWDLLLVLAPHVEQRTRLAEVLGGPGEIQICRQDRQPITFPWAFVYDIPVDVRDTSVPLIRCEAGRREIDRNLDAHACPGESEHTYNTLCPFGFWGYRHRIEQPLSLPPGRSLPLLAGRGAQVPSMTVARSLKLNETLSGLHMRALQESFPEGITDCDGREALKTALAAARHDCVYFYCHGRTPDGLDEAEETTVLEIGLSDRITPPALTAWAAAPTTWEPSSPLVFLNGCHTANSEPATWLSFVDAFSGLAAAGVIGTEISVEQALAAEVAERFWQYFLDSQPVGDALHRVRMELLRKGNVLGLAYTAYCSNGLRMRR